MTVFLSILLFLALARVLHIFNRERDPSWSGTVRDDSEEIRYRIGRNKGRVYSVTVGLALPGSLRLALRPEGVFDPIARRLGLALEFQTQDARFDDRVYIDCDDPALHDALATNATLRNAIYRLLPIGTGRHLRWANGWLWITRPREDLENGSDDAAIALAAARAYQPVFSELRAELARFRGEFGDPTRPARRKFDAAVIALFVAGGLGLAAHVFRHDHQVVMAQIPRIAVCTTATIGAILLLILLGFMRRISRTHNLLSDLVFAALPATFVAGWGGAMAINQAFDDGPAQRITLSTSGARESKGSKSTHYYLSVPAWPDDRARREVELTREEYREMENRACVDALWRSGRVGDPWIERFLPSFESNCAGGVEK